MFRVQFNEQPIIDRLQAAERRLDDPTPMYQEIGEYVVNATKQRFVIGEAPDGSKWAPKSQTTIDRYRAAGDGGRTKPLIGPSRRLSTEIHYFVSRAGVEVGSSLEYSGAMQSGAAKGAFGADRHGRPVPWGNIPARVWLGLSDRDNREIVDIADDYIGEALGG